MSIVSIADKTIRLPDILIFDASILLENLPTSPRYSIVKPFMARAHSAATKGDLLCLVTTLTFEECYFKLLQRAYENDLPNHVAQLRIKLNRPFVSWHDLYKDNPTLIRNYIPSLRKFRTDVLGIPVLPVEPSDLGSSPQALDSNMLDFVDRVPILPADAYLLAVAQRLRVRSIVTLDKDFHAATKLSFDIYTIA